MIKILLTGATGAVGTSILNKLTQENLFIFALSRTNHQNTDKLQWLQCDFNNVIDENVLKTIIEKVDIVIHNAASINIGTTSIEIQELQKTNIEFTEKLFRLASKYEKTIVYSSSLGIFPKPLPPLIDEKNLSGINPTAYHISKFWGENYLMKLLSENPNLLAYSLRISSPIAEKLDLQQNNVVKKWIVNALQEKPIEVHDVNRTQNFVHTTDIAKAIWQIIDNKPEAGIYNIASADSINMLELAQTITRKLPTQIVIKENNNVSNTEKWNIIIEKAQKNFGYKPIFNSQTAVEELIKNSI
jgi:nucleoside-diphosphate-sugar epimerase